MARHYKIVFLVSVFLALQFFILAQAKAEYRVYKLGVTYNPAAGGVETEVLTTLDDQQYATYYKITSNQQTRLIDHWMCKGRTDDFKTYCEKGEFPSRRELIQKSVLATTAQGPASTPK
jgi:hypothetical protein